MEQVCPNCMEDIKESGKCSKCDGLYCEGCVVGSEKNQCPHCKEEGTWERF